MEKAQGRSAVWRERLRTQQASGLGIAAWCKQEGVSAWSFYAWRKRLAAPMPGAPLIAVPLSGMLQGPMLELQTPGGYVLRLSSAEQVVTSPMPAQPIPGSIASASTVATILTAKYADGMPLYRMESVLQRSEVEIGRGTMGRWVIRSSEDWLGTWSKRCGRHCCART